MPYKLLEDDPYFDTVTWRKSFIAAHKQFTLFARQKQPTDLKYEFRPLRLAHYAEILVSNGKAKSLGALCDVRQEARWQGQQHADHPGQPSSRVDRHFPRIFLLGPSHRTGH